jgi:hypothetical protein
VTAGPDVSVASVVSVGSVVVVVTVLVDVVVAVVVLGDVVVVVVVLVDVTVVLVEVVVVLSAMSAPVGSSAPVGDSTVVARTGPSATSLAAAVTVGAPIVTAAAKSTTEAPSAAHDDQRWVFGMVVISPPLPRSPISDGTVPAASRTGQSGTAARPTPPPEYSRRSERPAESAPTLNENVPPETPDSTACSTPASWDVRGAFGRFGSKVVHRRHRKALRCGSGSGGCR